MAGPLAVADAPEETRRRQVASPARKARRSKRSSLTKEKACVMLHEGMARGQKITPAQRRLFAMRCGEGERHG